LQAVLQLAAERGIVAAMGNVTRILTAVEQGDRAAADELLPLVYQELRKLAAQKLNHEKPGQTLEATALVHEAYLRLVDDAPSRGWDHRGHFFAAAAEAMRRILVENARRKRGPKHGGNLKRQDLDEAALAAPDLPDDLLELDAALDKLARIDARKAELVKLRFFSGLTVAEAAQALGIAPSTADRDWAYAKAWLYREIAKGSAATA
jgi:RNA polymerase sigma factor (TIGR02999 family)